MQDWNGCPSLEQDNGSNGDRISITLTDKRDGNTYTVAKLKDGKCWMTQNLRLQNYTCTAGDSAVSNSFYIPSSNKGSFSRDGSFVWVDDSYGGYYSWGAANAGQPGEPGRYSICSRGWHLPSPDEYRTLAQLYNKDTIRKAPANFTLHGQYKNGQISFLEEKGYYHDNYENGSQQTFAFGLNCEPMVGGTSSACNGLGDWNIGHAIRCIFST